MHALYVAVAMIGEKARLGLKHGARNSKFCLKFKIP